MLRGAQSPQGNSPISSRRTLTHDYDKLCLSGSSFGGNAAHLDARARTVPMTYRLPPRYFAVPGANVIATCNRSSAIFILSAEKDVVLSDRRAGERRDDRDAAAADDTLLRENVLPALSQSAVRRRRRVWNNGRLADGNNEHQPVRSHLCTSEDVLYALSRTPRDKCSFRDDPPLARGRERNPSLASAFSLFRETRRYYSPYLTGLSVRRCR